MQWLKDGLEFLSPGWVGSLIGLVGVVAATITYFLTRQRTRLAFSHTGERLLGLSVDGLPTDISVQYRDKKIERLTRSLIVFWNDGEKTILADDIVATDPIKLTFGDDGFVLSATILKNSRQVIGSSVTQGLEETNVVELKFDFLDPSDGTIVEVLHTSENRYPKVKGTVRGLPKGLLNCGRIAGHKNTPQPFLLPGFPRKLAWITCTIGSLFSAAGLLIPSSVLDMSFNISNNVVLVGAGSTYAVLGATLLFLIRRRYPKHLHIDELGQ